MAPERLNKVVVPVGDVALLLLNVVPADAVVFMCWGRSGFEAQQVVAQTSPRFAPRAFPILRKFLLYLINPCCRFTRRLSLIFTGSCVYINVGICHLTT